MSPACLLFIVLMTIIYTIFRFLHQYFLFIFSIRLFLQYIVIAIYVPIKNQWVTCGKKPVVRFYPNNFTGFGNYAWLLAIKKPAWPTPSADFGVGDTVCLFYITSVFCVSAFPPLASARPSAAPRRSWPPATPARTYAATCPPTTWTHEIPNLLPPCQL